MVQLHGPWCKLSLSSPILIVPITSTKFVPGISLLVTHVGTYPCWLSVNGLAQDGITSLHVKRWQQNKGRFTWGPKSFEINMCNHIHCEHGSWDLPLHTWSQILSLKYGMDAHMTNFLVVRLGTCVVSWVEQKARPNHQLRPREYLCTNNQDSTLMIINHNIMIS